MYNVSSFSSQGGVSERNNPLPWFSVLRFGEGRLCSDVPSTAAAVQCFGAAFPPRLQTEQQGTMFTFHPLKIILESWVIQQIKNSHHGRGERIFVSSLLPSMWIRSHLCPSSAPSTAGSFHPVCCSPSGGLGWGFHERVRMWFLTWLWNSTQKMMQSCCFFLVSIQPCLCTLL